MSAPNILALPPRWLPMLPEPSCGSAHLGGEARLPNSFPGMNAHVHSGRHGTQVTCVLNDYLQAT